MADKLYGIWYQSKPYGCEGWYALEKYVWYASNIKIARAQAICTEMDKDPGRVNYVVCEIGDDGRPFNCDEELWEI